MFPGIVEREFGTFRGLVRTCLAHLMWLFGPYRKYGRINWARVDRVVFVCHGNICRSPFAHKRWSETSCPIPVVSVGLSTTTGVGADPTAIETAHFFGVDLAMHSATDLKDFRLADGDLLFVMEDRHIRALESAVAGRDIQIMLLGLWHRPRFALLYDPFLMNTEYFTSCFRRIDGAIARLAEEAGENIAH